MRKITTEKESELREFLRGITSQIDKIERLVDEIPNIGSNPHEITSEMLDELVEYLRSDVLPEITELCDLIKSYAGSIIAFRDGKKVISEFNQVLEKTMRLVDIAEQLRDLIRKHATNNLVTELISMFNEHVETLRTFFSEKVHNMLDKILELLRKIDSVL